jgi:hypothetical protein
MGTNGIDDGGLRRRQHLAVEGAVINRKFPTAEFCPIVWHESMLFDIQN